MSGKAGYIVEPERRVPLAGEFDVIVAGGGPAGIAAALSAARGGARTILVERYGYLGGMITGSHVIWIFGMGDGRLTMVRGIPLEIKRRFESLQAVTNYLQAGDYAVDAEVFKWQAAEMLEEAGVTIMLHTTACAPLMRDRRVGGLFTESKNGRQAWAAQVVVDCTADADIAHRAGCSSDSKTHDVTLIFKIAGVDKEAESEYAKAQPDRFRELVNEACRLNGGVMPGQSRYAKGFDTTSAADLTRAEVQLRRECFASLYYLRSRLPGWEKAVIHETLPQLGVRQSRRIRGEYILSYEDICTSRRFADTIGRLGATLKGYANYEPGGVAYDIPYRSLLPADADGILVAGRCISCDYEACNSLRLIVPCLATGQAAGTAAALAVRKGVQPRHLDIIELQTELMDRDVYLGHPSQPSPSLPTDRADDLQVSH